MTRAEIEAKWSKRLEEWRTFGAQVSGEKIAAEVLEDLRAASAGSEAQTMTPREAAAITNYHPESICRLVRDGKVKNYGTKHRPRVRLDELPRKSTVSPTLNPETKPVVAFRSVVGSNSSIARDAVAGRIGRQ